MSFYEVYQPVHDLQIKNRKKTEAIICAQYTINVMLKMRSMKKIKEDLKKLLELMKDAEVY